MYASDFPFILSEEIPTLKPDGNIIGCLFLPFDIANVNKSVSESVETLFIGYMLASSK